MLKRSSLDKSGLGHVWNAFEWGLWRGLSCHNDVSGGDGQFGNLE